MIGLARSLMLAFPPAHHSLWLRAKTAVWKEISAHWRDGTTMNDVLVVVAESTTITALVLVKFHRAQIIHCDDAVTIAVFVGSSADHFTRDSKGAKVFRRDLAKDDFALVVVDQTERSIISSCRVGERGEPN